MIKHYSTAKYDIYQKLYRYMSLEKFLYMITSEYITIPRITLFDDPFEYSYPSNFIKIISDARRRTHEKMGLDHEKIIEGTKNQHNLEELAKTWRNNHFVSCWHASNYESEAMWKLYASYGKGVAITTSKQKLINELPEYIMNEGDEHPLSVGDVQYFDFEQAGMELIESLGVFIDPIFLKRIAFEHEKEVRICIFVDEGFGFGNGSGVTKGVEGDVINIRVNINSLIDEIIIAPNTPKWQVDLINSICEKYGITIPIIESKLIGEPIIKWPLFLWE